MIQTLNGWWSWLARKRRNLPIVGMLIAFPLARVTAPWGTSMWLLTAGCFLAWKIGIRQAGDRVLFRVLVGGLAVRAALSVALYVIAMLRLPILSNLQIDPAFWTALGAGRGFWSFAPDAASHYVVAAQIVDAWRYGTELPLGREGGWYFMLLAVVYTVFGVHQLHGILVNALAAIASGGLAYAMTRRLAGTRAGRTAAALVTFWPSTVWWGTQLMKEQISILMVLLVLYAVIAALQEFGKSQVEPRWWRHAGLALGAYGAVFLVAMMRPLYPLVLATSGLIVFGVLAVGALFRRRVYQALAMMLVGGSMVAGMLMGRAVDPFYLVAPHSPWVGHLRLGLQEAAAGRLEAAEREFGWSLRLKPDYVPAKQELVLLLVRQNRFEDIYSLVVPSDSGQAWSDSRAGKDAQGPAAMVPSTGALTDVVPSDSGQAWRDAPGGKDAQGPAAMVPSTGALNATSTTPVSDTPIESPAARTESTSPVPAMEPDASSVTEPNGPMVTQLPNLHLQQAVQQLAYQEEFSQIATLLSRFGLHQSIGSRFIGRLQPHQVHRQTLSDIGMDWSKKTQVLNTLFPGIGAFPKRMAALREGQKWLESEGTSQLSPDVDISSYRGLFEYLPRGLAAMFFAPFPNELGGRRGVAGVLKSLSVIESLLLYLLAYFGARGSWRMIRARSPVGWFLLIYLGMGSVILALTMVNLGNLFRYRVPFLLALAILACVGGLPEIWHRPGSRRRIAV